MLQPVQVYSHQFKVLVNAAGGTDRPAAEQSPPPPVVSGWTVVDKQSNVSSKINFWHDRVHLNTPLYVRGRTAFQVWCGTRPAMIVVA